MQAVAQGQFQPDEKKGIQGDDRRAPFCNGEIGHDEGSGVHSDCADQEGPAHFSPRTVVMVTP